MVATRKLMASWAVWVIVIVSFAHAGPLPAQPARGTLERIKVHGASLERNLEGDDATREVFVYLPPSYHREPTRRYPVLYFLHGYTATAERYVSYLGLPEAADAAIANGAREMIIVLPDAFTVYSGSMYSNSPTTGDWESFVADDLVGYIDAHYHTMAKRESRGLAGHSMGGYGTWRIGMKRPDVFGALYAMSSCCLLIDPARGGDPVMRAARQRAEAGRSPSSPATGDQSPSGRPDPSAGFANALFAQAAAWAPDPANPPRYFDLPTKDGKIDPLIAAKWLANSPLVMVDQYVPSLRRYKAIALDVGDADPLGADNVRLDAELTRLHVEHSFEQYEGDHGNRIKERFGAKVLPFFSRSLSFEDVVPSDRSAAAEEAAGAHWPVEGVEAPKTELVLEAYVRIAPAVTIGKSDAGTRRFIPITGGRFVGDDIKGEVMAGGADWQLVRPDGVLEVNALYSIRTDDGVTIEVDNRGIIVPGASPAPGRPAAAQSYVRTTPKFHAPEGKYDWLNKNVFVGGIAPATGGGAVVIRVFKVL